MVVGGSVALERWCRDDSGYSGSDGNRCSGATGVANGDGEHDTIAVMTSK